MTIGANVKTVEIGISTVGDRIEKIRELLPLMGREKALFSIFHQVKSPRAKPEWLPAASRYFQSTATGVGKSRNILLSRAIGNYLWFMDDDIVLPRESLDAICELVKVIRFDGFIIGCDRRSNPSTFTQADLLFNVRKLNNWEITNIGTPRIILSMPAAGYERFPEDVGAGTEKPFGDEAIFLGKCLRGRDFLFSTVDLISHSYDSSGTRGARRWKLRAEIYLRTFGLLGGIWVLFRKLWLKMKMIK